MHEDVSQQLRGEHSTMQRSDALSQTQIENMHDLYRSTDVAVQLPYTKKVTKAGPLKVLQMSISKAYDKFKTPAPQNTNPAVKLSKFQRLRPSDVKLQRSQTIRNCL